MALTTQYQVEYLKKLIRGIYDNTVEKKETFYEKFVNVVKTEDEFERWVQDSGLGLFVPIEESGKHPLDMPVKGGTIDVHTYKYGLGFVVTEKMKLTDKWDRAAVLAKQLAQRGKDSMDIAVASILNNAFNSNYKGFDGKKLCATDHTILRTGATWANEPASAVSFGLTAFQNALTHFSTLLDDAGLPSPMPITYLITHPTNRIVAEEILKSQLVPYSADNTENIYKGLVTPIYNPYLTSQTAWFFVGPKDESLTAGSGHSMFLLLLKEPKLRDWDDPDTGNTFFVADAYWNVGFLHPRGVYGDEGV